MQKLNLSAVRFNRSQSNSRIEFRNHEDLIQRAKANPPTNPTNVVSDFSSWVFGLCFERPRDWSASLQRGRNAERQIHRMRKSERSRIPKFSPPENFSWQVEYEDPLDDNRSYFSSRKLHVNGRRMVGRPDLVLRKRGTRQRIIVERKT